MEFQIGASILCHLDVVDQNTFATARQEWDQDQDYLGAHRLIKHPRPRHCGAEMCPSSHTFIVWVPRRWNHGSRCRLNDSLIVGRDSRWDAAQFGSKFKLGQGGRLRNHVPCIQAQESRNNFWVRHEIAVSEMRHLAKPFLFSRERNKPTMTKTPKSSHTFRKARRPWLHSLESTEM